MTGVLRIPLAYNSAYLVQGGDDRILIDTGPDYRGAWETIGAAVEGSQPGLVVATHGHLDHAGLGSRWIEAGVAVAIGAADAVLCERPQFSDPAELDVFEEYVRASGAPADVCDEMVRGIREGQARRARAALSPDYQPARDRNWPTALRYPPFAPSRLLADCEALPCGAKALSCPGHTPGNLVVVVMAEGWLFSGDQLLPDITPTPAIQWRAGAREGDSRFRSLPAFAASLERLRGYHFVRCFPGHGEPFGDVRGAIDANLAQIEQRTERVLEALREGGEATLYELCERLYPKAVRRRAWQILATIQGHVDLLEDQGRVVLISGMIAAV